MKTRARRNPDQTNVNLYAERLKQEGIPVYQDHYIADLRAAEVKPWKRMGVLGAHADLIGGEGVKAGYFCEIPAGTSTNPQRYLFGEVVYVLSGEGERVIWTPSGSKRSAAGAHASARQDQYSQGRQPYRI